MRLVHGADLEWNAPPPQHRVGRLSFKRLLDGQPGTPENYSLSIAKPVGDFHSPRHRHNFDQFRFSLKADYEIGPKLEIKEGQFGYFPEGTYYGPYDTPEDRETLVLQFGGASGQGYIGIDEIRAGFLELSKVGRFEDGAYKVETPDGRRKNKDAYEAVWEHLTGRDLVYPKPRYVTPVIVDPEAFAWCEVPGQAGVRVRMLGVFTERGTRVEILGVASGASATLPAEEAIRIVFVLRGEGEVGSQPYKADTAIEISAGEAATLTARGGETHALVMTLPMIRQSAEARAA